jgi:hypothetical protein
VTSFELIVKVTTIRGNKIVDLLSLAIDATFCYYFARQRTWIIKVKKKNYYKRANSSCLVFVAFEGKKLLLYTYIKEIYCRLDFLL